MTGPTAVAVLAAIYVLGGAPGLWDFIQGVWQFVMQQFTNPLADDGSSATAPISQENSHVEHVTNYFIVSPDVNPQNLPGFEKENPRPLPSEDDSDVELEKGSSD